jgi:hypothetical protein
MRKIIFYIIFTVLSFESFSQALVWEKLIDYFPGNEEVIYSIDQDSDTTFVFTTSTLGNTATTRAKLNGDTLWMDGTNISSCYAYNRITTYRNDQLMHFGNKSTDCMYWSNFFFQKLSHIDGTVLSTWEYGDSGVQNFLHTGTILPNGGFLASGQRQSTYYYYLSLMKLDSSGDMLWYKKYRDISWTTDVIINRKGNYLLSASTGDQIVSPVLHPYFIEVSPDGDSINSKYLIVHADTVNEQKNMWTWGMLQNEDEDYVFTITIDSVQQKGGTLLDRYAAVVMMDTLFNIKWKLYLNKGTGGAFYPTRVIELKDSTYVLVVMNTQPYSSSFYYYKISKTGQILDQETFTSSICNKVHSTEIKVLNDGSMLVSGGCKDYENAYLARIDSVGLPMVIAATDPPKEATSEWSVQVYPNPFTEKINFKITDKPGRNYTLVLYNNLGQKIAEHRVSNNGYTIERNTLAAGLYFYKLANDKGETRSGKLLAE